MTLAQIIEAVDALPPAERKKVYEHLRDLNEPDYVWSVPGTQVAKMADVFAAVREEALSMTDEEINEAIDAAITAVRRERDDDAQSRN